MIKSKIVVPPVGDRLVVRPRVSLLLAELIEGHRVVWVCATAGAGKTTAVVQAAGLLEDRILCWLTVDDSDAAPGRLLTYLEAALARQVPAAAGVASGALGARIPHTEAAGLLAEATADAPVLLVVDGLERLAHDDDALAVLGAFARYAPPAVRIVLISRTELALDIGATSTVGAVAAIGEATLALTPGEAAEVLERAGHTSLDPARAVEATGGWMTGVLFEAWRSAEHVAGTGGEADPLHGYLATQILSKLERADRDFLVVTSLLDEVTASRAEALGLAAAGERLAALRAKHLPVSWGAQGAGMRCHPRFREYLLQRLTRRDGHEVRALRLAHGELLMEEEHYEEAVEQFLAIGELERALAGVERTIVGVVERLDFDVADRWLETVAPVAPAAPNRLTTPELMLAIGREDFGRGGRVADSLADARQEFARASTSAASMMAWCYWHLGRVDDARAVIAAADRSPDVDALLYLLTLVHNEPHPGQPFTPELTGGPLDALVMRVHYAHGRLRELTEPPTSSWAAAVTGPWRIGALRAMGHTEEALDLFRTSHAGAGAPAWMHGIVEPELMIDLGEIDEARRAVMRGRELVDATGSVVFEMLNRLIEAKLELRLARDPEAALAVLGELEAREESRRYDFIGEQLDTWSGLALLMQSQDAAPVERLTRAADSMEAAERILELPTATVLLAEAHWRNGDEDAADRAADRALAAAARQGSNHILLQALADFPSVVARRLDAEAASDSPWHEIGRALMARGVAIELNVQTVVELAEFGRAAIDADGREVRPRLAKSVALLAYLASVPGHAADRDDLLGALFDGRSDDSARSYLRQVVHRLREALPEGVGPSFEGGRVRFDRHVVLAAESARVESLLARASRLQGEDRLGALIEALAIVDRGEYLPEVDTRWVAERRAHLAGLATDARLEAARLAFAAGRYRQAESLVEAVLEEDPFKESAWRLAMRIANAVGNEDRVIASYQRCKSALDELGAAPSGSTQQLLEQLRR